MTWTLAAPIVAVALLGGIHQGSDGREVVAVAATTTAKDPDFKRWVGRRLVSKGEAAPKSRKFLLEKDIPSPHVIFKPGTVGDTVFISDRIDVRVDANMMIVGVWKG